MIAKAQKIVALFIAIALAVALIIGALRGVNWESLLVLAWFSLKLLGKRTTVETLVGLICGKGYRLPKAGLRDRHVEAIDSPTSSG